MKTINFFSLFIAFAALLLLTGCTADDKDINVNDGNRVLMLKVDYTTNKFEGGIEFIFPSDTETFTITNEYVSPGDFGSIKLFYKELDAVLFYGTITWNGLGKMIFPEKLKPAGDFKYVLTEDYIFPGKGFENVFELNEQEADYNQVWSQIQNLVLVRKYLSANPSQKVKIFLYTPSVGAGNPSDWVWIIYLKN